MKTWNPREFRKELSIYERMGSLAVRELCIDAIEKWGSDRECLVELTEIFRSALDFPSDRVDDDLAGVYCLLREETYLYVRQHYSPEDYHYFCEAMDYEKF